MRPKGQRISFSGSDRSTTPTHNPGSVIPSGCALAKIASTMAGVRSVSRRMHEKYPVAVISPGEGCHVQAEAAKPETQLPACARGQL